MAVRQGNDFSGEECSWTSLLLPGKEAASLDVACHSSSCHPGGLDIVLPPMWVHSGGSAGHTCNLCLPELSAVIPKACFWLQRQQWAAGEAGRGCGFWGVLRAAGVGVGSCREHPGKPRLLCCGVCCSQRDFHLVHRAAQPISAPGVPALAEAKPTKD